MGRDHLLHIASGVFIEEYKHFYFRDIQSLMVHQSKSWIVVNIVLAVLVAGLIFLTVASGDLVRTIAGIIAFVMLVILVVNFIRGPGCVCYIQTAVQKQKLRSISRIKKAQQIMDSLKPIILRSQQEG
jgi:hypothetical protein